MRVRDLLGAESIELQGKAATKKEVIEQMVQLMAKRGNINDLEKYEKGVFAREEEGTTGIGEGIAIPHCKSDAVSARRAWRPWCCPRAWTMTRWTDSRCTLFS